MGDVDGNVGTWGFARGGMGAVSESIAGAFQAYGGELRTEAGVDQIIVKNGKTTGVALENGEEISGRIVVSAMDVKRTFLTCMDKSDLPEAFYNRVENFKIRGSSGKLNIALDGLPTFPALPEGSSLYHSDMHFIDSMERMERAYDDWKDGTWSKDPYIDMVIPTLMDPTMAPPGKHFMSCFIQYCPHKLEGRDWTDAEARGVRENRHRSNRELQPGLQRPDSALRDSYAAGHRRPDRYYRGQYFPWRVDDGSACCSTGRCLATRNIEHRLPACTCVDRVCTLEAALWRHRERTQHGKSFRTSNVQTPSRRISAMTDQIRCNCCRGRPQRSRVCSAARQSRANKCLCLRQTNRLVAPQ